MNSNRNIVQVTVVIPTLNRVQSLTRTLECLLQHSNAVPDQIIVVDQTADAVQREKIANYVSSLDCDYVYQSIPSLTAARNLGMLNSRNDIIVFMDDDVDVNSDTLLNIYSCMKRQNVAMIGAIDELLPTGGSKLGCLFDMKSPIHRNIGHVTKAMLGRYPDKLSGEVKTMWAMGFCFAIKKSLADKWNIRFDEKLTGYAYAEDLDFTYGYYKHATKEGLVCLLSDQIKVKHLESKEYRIPSIKSTYKYVINREYLSYKHNEGIISRLLCRWANFGQFLFRLLKHAEPFSIIMAQFRCDILRGQLRHGIILECYSDENFSGKGTK